MKKRKKRGWIALFFVACLCLNLPDNATNAARSFAIGGASFGWGGVNALKKKFLIGEKTRRVSQEVLEELEELKKENEILSIQLAHIRQWLISEDRVQEDFDKIHSLEKEKLLDRDFLSRRRKEISKLLLLDKACLPAKVIYREPASWSSFIWINVGESANNSLGKKIIAKNSPVVIGNTLLGVVEVVESSKAKVRLITDHRLVPAVRAIRGEKQYKCIVKHLESLFDTVQMQTDFDKIRLAISEPSIDLYLAKGELHGSSYPLWHARGQMLQGVGFNYDFPDEEGPARDLRMANFLIEEGDLLITSGLDGVFPAGLEVAIVHTVARLQEGAIAYEITAKSLIPSLNEIELVKVLPPVTTLTLP